MEVQTKKSIQNWFQMINRHELLHSEPFTAQTA